VNNRGLHIVLLLFFVVVGYSQRPVTVILDTTSATVGDLVMGEISIRVPYETTIEKVLFEDIQPGFEMELVETTQFSEDESSGRAILKSTFSFICFEPYRGVFPPIPVTLTKSTGELDTMYSSALPFEVVSMITQDSTGLRSIKYIYEEPKKFSDYLPYLIALFVIGLLGFLSHFLWKRKTRKVEKPIEAIPSIPPHIVAKKKLGLLKEKRLWQTGKLKPYYTELSFILREYIENRFEIGALEATTSELRRMIRTRDFSEVQQRNILKVLQTSDSVKFADAEPDLNVHDELFERTEFFINETIVKPVNEEEE
jgi:hypothetical protein